MNTVAEGSVKVLPKVKGGNPFLAFYRLFLFFFGTCCMLAWHLGGGMVCGFSNGHGARSIRKWSKMINMLTGIKVRVSGTVPSEGVLLVSNHRSYMDVTVLGQWLPVTFLAKEELRSWPLLGFATASANCVFVNRSNPESRKRARETVREHLSGGTSIMVYPEGTSFEGPGLLTLKPGIFQMAAEAGVIVVPVAIEYDDPGDAWVGDDTFIRHFFQAFGKKEIGVALRFGPPMKSSDYETLRTCSREWIDGALNDLRTYGGSCAESNKEE